MEQTRDGQAEFSGLYNSVECNSASLTISSIGEMVFTLTLTPSGKTDLGYHWELIIRIIIYTILALH